MSGFFLLRYLNFRTLALGLFYLLVCAVGYFLAYELRFDFGIPEHHALDRVTTIWWVVLMQFMLLVAGGQLDSVLSYFRLPDVMRLFGSLFLAMLVLLSMWYFYDGKGVPPRAVILTDFLLVFLFIVGFRVALRVRSSRGLEDWLAGRSDAQNVVIVGAGEVGAGLCAELMSKARLGMRPVAFVDDSPRKVGRYVHGLPVADSVEGLSKVAKRYSASKAVIAFPSASVKRIRTVAEDAREAGLAVDIVPALSDLVSGRAQMTQLRPVQLEDLLGRDPVDLNSDRIRAMVEGKRVLVTGAGGSIGSELVAQILQFKPGELCCVDQAEMAIFNLQEKVLVADPSGTARTRILDISEREEVARCFDAFRPEVVFHAAAHKHVNLMESQPREALRNNFRATAGLAEEAGRHAVERFVLISSDKAINPTSVMGASKRLAELAIQARQRAGGNRTKFMAVRFGNVLGSSGSVVPIFRRQIAAGGPVTVTDPEVTRYFMTVEEAVGLVLQSATQGEGGEIFVLDMGEPVKIVDVARQMIALSGLREGEDIDIVFTGLRPGEKLYEEVQHLSEALHPTEHPRVMRFVSGAQPDFDAEAVFRELSAETTEASIKRAIARFVPEYRPYFDGEGA